MVKFTTPINNGGWTIGYLHDINKSKTNQIHQLDAIQITNGQMTDNETAEGEFS